jgi:hypothetical protein
MRGNDRRAVVSSCYHEVPPLNLDFSTRQPTLSASPDAEDEATSRRHADDDDRTPADDLRQG